VHRRVKFNDVGPSIRVPERYGQHFQCRFAAASRKPDFSRYEADGVHANEYGAEAFGNDVAGGDEYQYTNSKRSKAHKSKCRLVNGRTETQARTNDYRDSYVEGDCPKVKYLAL
jgi:hypothetical protein